MSNFNNLVPRGGSKVLDFGWLNACKWETLHINNCRIWSLSERIEGCQTNGIGTLGVSSIQHLTLSITVDKSVRQESVPYSFPIFMDLHFFREGIFGLRFKMAKAKRCEKPRFFGSHVITSSALLLILYCAKLT